MCDLKLLYLVFSSHSDKPLLVRFRFAARARQLLNARFPINEREHLAIRLSTGTRNGWTIQRDMLNFFLYNINSGNFRFRC